MAYPGITGVVVTDHSYFSYQNFVIEVSPPNELCTLELYRMFEGVQVVWSPKHKYRVEVEHTTKETVEKVLYAWFGLKGLQPAKSLGGCKTIYQTKETLTPFPQEFTLCLGEWDDGWCSVIDPPHIFFEAFKASDKKDVTDYVLTSNKTGVPLSADELQLRFKFVSETKDKPSHQDVIQLCYDVLADYDFEAPTEQFVKDGKTRVVFRKGAGVRIVETEPPTATGKKRKRNLLGDPVISLTSGSSDSTMSLLASDSLIQQIKTQADGTIVVCLINGEAVQISSDSEGQQTVSLHYTPKEPATETK